MITSLNYYIVSILIEMFCFFSEIGTEFLNVILISSVLQRVNTSLDMFIVTTNIREIKEKK